MATPLPGLLRLTCFVLRLALALPWPHFRLDLCCLGPASLLACPKESSYDRPDSYFAGPDHVLARYGLLDSSGTLARASISAAWATLP